MPIHWHFSGNDALQADKIHSEKDYPHLFNFANVTAEEHYSNNYDVEKSMKLEKLRDVEVMKGVKTFISKNNDWDFFIIE